MRHAVWINDFVTTKGDSPSGQAGHGEQDLDFLMALDGDTDPDVHESTFIHELGHSLGLDHGGAPKTCQLQAELPERHELRDARRRAAQRSAGGFRFDFSHQKLDTLDEAFLDERKVLGGPAEPEDAVDQRQGRDRRGRREPRARLAASQRRQGRRLHARPTSRCRSTSTSTTRSATRGSVRCARAQPAGPDQAAGPQRLDRAQRQDHGPGRWQERRREPARRAHDRADGHGDGEPRRPLLPGRLVDPRPPKPGFTAVSSASRWTPRTSTPCTRTRTH